MKTAKSFFLALTVLLSLTFFNACNKKEGVDMKITLETSAKDILVNLSGYAADSILNEAFRVTDSVHAVDSGDYINEFEKVWKKSFAEENLAFRFFPLLQEKISQTSSNDEVMAVIRTEYKDAVSKTAEVLKKRLDDYDIYDFEVKLSDTVGLITLQLEGVKDTARVMKVIQTRGRLEFWETYEYRNVQSYFDEADAILKAMFTPATGEKSKDTTLLADANIQTDSLADGIAENEQPEQQKYSTEHPLYAKLKMALVNDGSGKYSPAAGPVVGNCKIKDTARVNYLLSLKAVKDAFPRDARFVWTVVPTTDDKKMLQLIVLKSTRDNLPSLSWTSVSDASSKVGENGVAQVLISMNEEGARIWSRMTRENVELSIAIMIDGHVYAYPTVMDQIPDGKSSITGNFTEEETIDLAAILKAGMMPLSVRVVSLSVTAVDAGK